MINLEIFQKYTLPYSRHLPDIHVRFFNDPDAFSGRKNKICIWDKTLARGSTPVVAFCLS